MSDSPPHKDLHSFSEQGNQRDLTAKAFKNPHHSHTEYKADSFLMTTVTERSTSQGESSSHGIFSFSRFLSRSLILNHFHSFRDTGKPPPKPQKAKPSQSISGWLCISKRISVHQQQQQQQKKHRTKRFRLLPHPRNMSSSSN